GLLVPRRSTPEARANALRAPRAACLAGCARVAAGAARDDRREPLLLRGEEPPSDAAHLARVRVERARRARVGAQDRGRRIDRRQPARLAPRTAIARARRRARPRPGGERMNGIPMVSVIVPAFNAERTIGDCLAALVGQDYPRERLEIIAVDNRSTDRTAAVMCAYPVRVVAERRVQSSYAARNAGLAEARGAILCFTDADCLPDTGWVRALVAGLADDDAGGAAGR